MVVIAAGLALAGCTVDNPGPGIMIHNTTNEPVVVVYHRAGHKMCYALHPEVRSQLSEAKRQTLDLGCCEVTFRR